MVNSGRSNDKKKAVKDSKESLDAGDFEEKSCFVFKRTFFVRKWFIHLVHWPYPLIYYINVKKIDFSWNIKDRVLQLIPDEGSSVETSNSESIL